MCSVTAHFIL